MSRKFLAVIWKGYFQVFSSLIGHHKPTCHYQPALNVANISENSRTTEKWLIWKFGFADPEFEADLDIYDWDVSRCRNFSKINKASPPPT